MQSSIVIFLLGTLFGSFFSTQANADSSKILIMGDSLSAAYNIAMEQSWPVLFQQKLKQNGKQLEVVNASISGETSAGGLERLPALLQKHQPDFMILELGGNDGLRGYKFSHTRQNLKNMVQMARGKNMDVLMIGVRLPPNLGPVYNQKFQQIYDQLAEELSLDYLPRFLQGIAASDAKYMQADGIHPTSVAQPLLANKVFQALTWEKK